MVSVSNSASVIVGQLLNNPASITQTLAANLPRASNFYYSYMMLQGLSVTSGSLLQVFTLIQYAFKLLRRTSPRSEWTRQNGLSSFYWSANLPVVSNLATIGKNSFRSISLIQ